MLHVRAAAVAHADADERLRPRQVVKSPETSVRKEACRLARLLGFLAGFPVKDMPAGPKRRSGEGSLGRGGAKEAEH